MSAENAGPVNDVEPSELPSPPDAVVESATLEAAVLETATLETVSLEPPPSLVDSAFVDGASLDAVSVAAPVLGATLPGHPADARPAVHHPIPHDPEPYDPASVSRSAETVEPTPTGTLSAERLAAKALEARLLGGERKLRRREVAAGAGLSLLSARKLWRALGFPNLGDEDVAFTERDQAALSTVVDLVRTGALTEEAAISVTRAIGQMTDRMVVWQIEALVEDLVHQQGVPDAVARKMLVKQLPSLVDALEEMLTYSWRRQLNAGVQRLAVRAEAGLQASEEGREGDEDDAPLLLG